MSWKLYRWIWQLRSPLHVGHLPAGAVNRTRLYIPARAFWGALTAELARTGAEDFPDYQNTGQIVSQQCRFSYLFPAQQLNGHWRAWLPRFECGQGLVWRREDVKDANYDMSDRGFRSWLLTTRPGTAIDPHSDTATEGTLREYEVVKPWSHWGDKGEPRPVAFAGYVMLNDDTAQDIFDIPELLIGGDTRYGLGWMKRVACSEATDFFGRSVQLSGNDPVIETKEVLAHTLPIHSHNFVGSYEQLAMWDFGVLSVGHLTWMPGSAVHSGATRWLIREDSLWERSH